ncbi:MAG: hypothetical protein B7Y02_11275 [Rhodobacterales bacterium 17-64-5]|nr:MAG: hypothetical protein B7Y02_11275 [Rhodobacterales bacterium 17-64-5]
MSDAILTPFGTTATGVDVAKVTLRCEGLSAAILTKGATLQSVRLDGVDHDLTLGSDRLADYEGKMRHHGSLVAPVVNRFKGAKAPIGGKMYTFEANQDGTHTLHCGAAGTQHKVWAVAASDETSVTLTLDLPDGEGNMPGNRHVTARFSLHPGNRLRLEVTATTDALTLFNAANHSYWNLDGTATWDGHSLQIAAATYLPIDEDFCATGEIAEVAGTAMDFRRGRKVTRADTVLDNNFCLSGGRQPLRVIVDSGLRTPLDAAILPALIACHHADPATRVALEQAGAEVLELPGTDRRVDLPALLTLLSQRGINELHVEAGAGLNGALLAAWLVDEWVAYVAPMAVGDSARGLFGHPPLMTLAEAARFRLGDVRVIGSDLRLTLLPQA